MFYVFAGTFMLYYGLQIAEAVILIQCGGRYLKQRRAAAGAFVELSPRQHTFLWVELAIRCLIVVTLAVCLTPVYHLFTLGQTLLLLFSWQTFGGGAVTAVLALSILLGQAKRKKAEPGLSVPEAGAAPEAAEEGTPGKTAVHGPDKVLLAAVLTGAFGMTALLVAYCFAGDTARTPLLWALLAWVVVSLGVLAALWFTRKAKPAPPK